MISASLALTHLKAIIANLPPISIINSSLKTLKATKPPIFPKKSTKPTYKDNFRQSHTVTQLFFNQDDKSLTSRQTDYRSQTDIDARDNSINIFVIHPFMLMGNMMYIVSSHTSVCVAICFMRQSTIMINSFFATIYTA